MTSDVTYIGFPELCEKNVDERKKIWTISVKKLAAGGAGAGTGGAAIIKKVYGLDGGKMRIMEETINSGKNIGKSNETTPFQQAVSESIADWRKKIAAGYLINEESKNSCIRYLDSDSAKSDSDDIIEDTDEHKTPAQIIAEIETVVGLSSNKGKVTIVDIPKPMLAEKYQGRGHLIKFPCYVQPKLDGTRCIAVCGPHAKLYSRTRKLMSSGLSHITDTISSLPEGLILDGELYSHSLPFNEISGLVRKDPPVSSAGLEKYREKVRNIRLHVYDVIAGVGGSGAGAGSASFSASAKLPTFTDRIGYLAKLFNITGEDIGGAGGEEGKKSEKEPLPYLDFVETVICKRREDVMKFHAEYVEKGYEGVMCRNAESIYVNKRTPDLQKVKTFEDDEFVIVDFEQGTGVEDGCVIWVCKTEKGKRFSCRPQGNHDERRELYTNGSDYVGKMLTVRYQELSEDGIPRFPVGVRIRDGDD